MFPAAFLWFSSRKRWSPDTQTNVEHSGSTTQVPSHSISLFSAFKTLKFHIHSITWLENLPKFQFGVIHSDARLHARVWLEFLSFAFIDSGLSLYFSHRREGLGGDAQFSLSRKVFSHRFLRCLLVICPDINSRRSVRSGWILSRRLVPGSTFAGVIALLVLPTVVGSCSSSKRGHFWVLSHARPFTAAPPMPGNDLCQAEIFFMSLFRLRRNTTRWPGKVTVGGDKHAWTERPLAICHLFLRYHCTCFKMLLKLKCMLEITLSSTAYWPPLQNAWWQSLRRCWKGGGGLKIYYWLAPFLMISHETHPRDILIFDHTALAVAPASLLLSAILSFPFAAWGLRSSVHTTHQWLHKYVPKQNRNICTDWSITVL